MRARFVGVLAIVSLLAACGGGGGDYGGPAPSGARTTPSSSWPPPEFYAAPMKVSETQTFTAIAAGYFHTCAIDVGGETYCWGSNEYGQLGSAASMETCAGGQYACSSTPVLAASGRRFTQLVASDRHTCGLDAAGAAHCWGFGLGGQLGDGSRTNSVEPLAVAGGRTFNTLTASVADGATCGLTAGGDAWCWGINPQGALGTGAKGPGSAVPGPLATSLKLISISIGQAHACALDTAGNAICWGNNWYGQLGVGSAGGSNGFMESFTPVAVVGGLTFKQIVAGGTHSCALQDSGAVWCWGFGLLLGAKNAAGYQSLPLPVVLTGAKWLSIARGFGQTCALAEDHALYCWGQLTTEDPSSQASTAVHIGSGQKFVAFAPGGTHACAIGTDGFAYCWGRNTWGQVGRPASDP
jgi:alpha-tubulin suppressor-like RCC1 family protein